MVGPKEDRTPRPLHCERSVSPAELSARGERLYRCRQPKRSRRCANLPATAFQAVGRRSPEPTAARPTGGRQRPARMERLPVLYQDPGCAEVVQIAQRRAKIVGKPGRIYQRRASRHSLQLAPGGFAGAGKAPRCCLMAPAARWRRGHRSSAPRAACAAHSARQAIRRHGGQRYRPARSGMLARLTSDHGGDIGQ